MGLFRKKSDRHVMILMMDCDASGTLTKIMEDMTDSKRVYAMEGVCLNFVRIIYGDRLKPYAVKNIRALFPNHWDSPLYLREKEGMARIAEDCARDFIRKNLPDVDPEQTVINVDEFPGKPYAGVSFEY